MVKFTELGISGAVLRGLADLGFEEPTPVQAQAIPPLLEGQDLVVQALTGTGKTAAFGIPLVEGIDVKRRAPQAVVLVPTRELAIQVAEHLTRLGHHRGLRLTPIYGGQPIDRQLRALQHGIHIIVATPGRLMDHMRRGSVELGEVRTLVLDEADRMLDMGFQEDVEYVMAHLPEERLTAMFSATMPKEILDIAGRYMRNPQTMRLSRPQALTVPEIDQVFYQVPFPRKLEALCRVLDSRQVDRAMVFCATKRMVDEVTERLQGRGYVAEGLHGEFTQAAREKALRAFRTGHTEVLVATDVAARGLDVPDVGLVVNFDIPPDPEYYVHRIGRTGRSGKRGEAVTFINPREMGELRMIERATGARIRQAEVPTAAEVEGRDLQILEERVLDVLSKDGWRRFRAVAEDLMGEHDPLDVAAAALSLAGNPRAGRAPKSTTPDPYDVPRGEDRAPVRPAARAGKGGPVKGGPGRARPAKGAAFAAGGWKPPYRGRTAKKG